MKMSTLKMVMLTLIVVCLWSSMAMATTNAWVLNGNVTLAVSSANIHPTLSLLKYDDEQVMLDAILNLPAAFSLQFTEYAGLNDSDLDGDKGDEMGVALWKKFVPAPDMYLKLRLKYVNGWPVCDLNGKDLLAYDLFLGRTYSIGAHTVTAEWRFEYWHTAHSLSDGMITIIPSLYHEQKFGSKLTAYQMLALQWNEEMAPFGELLSAQAKIGLKAKLSKGLSWNVIDIGGIQPITEPDDADPRQNGEVAYTTSLCYRF